MSLYKFSLPFSLLVSGVCYAHGDNIEQLYSMSLEELSQVQVVTAATGYTQKLKKAPATVTVIEKEEWQARGVDLLSQALMGVPGLQVVLVNEGNTEKRFKIRGLSGTYGQQVKLLIDGIPYNRVHHGGIPGLELSLAGFKRIEVVRSPGAVAYGADAYGGVINLVSDTDSKEQVVSASFASYDQQTVSAKLQRDFQQFSSWLTLNYYNVGKDSDQIIPEDLQSAFDQAFSTSASLTPEPVDMSQESLNINLHVKWPTLAFQYYGIDGNYSTGVGVAETLDPGKKINHYSHLLKLTYQLPSVFDDAELITWYQKKRSSFDFTIFPAGTVLPIGADGNLNFVAPTTITTFTDGYIGHPGNNTEQYHIHLKSHHQWQNHQIVWQVGHEKVNHNPFEQKNFGPGVLNGTETIVDGTLTDVTRTPYVYLPYRSRHFNFASIQDSWQYSDSLTFNLGIRYDHYSDFGTTVNPRLGFNWDVNDWLDVRVFTGSAFRAPSFVGLYTQNNPIATGNPNLKPEEIDTDELSLDITFSDSLQSSITLFQYDASRLVKYAAVPDKVGLQAINLGKLSGEGIEWQIRWRPNTSFDLLANYSHLNSEDFSGASIHDYAENMASLTINYRLSDQITTNVFAQYFGEQPRREADSRKPLANFYWLTAAMHYQINQKLTVSLVVNNLNDSDNAYYPSNSIPSDYPYVGRQYQLKAKYRF